MLLFWIILGTSDHSHLKWLNKLVAPFDSYHMQNTNFITQLIIEIELAYYLLSLLACVGMPDHTQSKQPINICCFMDLYLHPKIQIHISTYLQLKESCILIGLEVFGS